MQSFRFRMGAAMNSIMALLRLIRADCRKGPRPRDIVDPYLHLDTIKVKTRDFR